MSKVFISYRRDDSADVCGRINDLLVARFGAENVFKDVDSIPLGADFRQILRNAVEQCAIMLVLIGRHWISVTDAQGHRRLDNPNDFVRLEVEAALARNIPVIPVLIHEATIPQESELPPSLSALAYRHGIEVRSDPHFHRDMGQLMNHLAPLLNATPSLPPIAPDHFPQRLASLGFVGKTAIVNGKLVEYIVPPLCDVPAGPFLMGSDPKCDKEADAREQPQHRITLPAYEIARYPTTVAEYACFVRGGHAEPQQGTYKPITWQQQLQHLDHPVVCVSWHDAVAYAKWLAERTGQLWRLPSEAEWEKAARWDPQTNTSRLYPWGDQFDQSRCNTSESNNGGTTSIDRYPGGISACSALDLAGNVWDWTSTLYRDYPYNTADGREVVNSLDTRVPRGGSWDDSARDARPAFRVGITPGGLDGYFGFRLAVGARASL